MYHFENTVLCNDTLKILYDPLYGQLSARCDHFCPSSERVKLLTSHRVWSKNDRIYLDLVRDPSTTRNMIAFPEFSNRLPWNSIEHYCLRLEERKNSKKKNEKWTRSRRKIEKKSIIWLEIILNREFHQNSYFLLKLENSISVLFYLIAIYSYSSFLIYLYLVEKLRFRKWKIRINVISKNLPLENI